MAKVGGFEELEIFLSKTAKGILIKTKNDMGTVALEIGKAVVQATPVDTGRARANWQPSLNFPSSSPIDAFDPSGTSTPLKIAAVAKRMTVDNSFHLTNRVPYIGLLDRGHSSQAPPGFIK